MTSTEGPSLRGSQGEARPLPERLLMGSGPSPFPVDAVLARLARDPHPYKVDGTWDTASSQL